MILVIGGEASGKRAYARSLGYRPADMADGVLDERPVLCHLEALVARTQQNAEELLPALLEKELVLCNEIGSGVIPAEPETRRSRVTTGRLCILLAQRADRVVRMVCGIPTVIREAGAAHEDQL